jgi:phage terminase large subunit-like protein
LIHGHLPTVIWSQFRKRFPLQQQGPTKEPQITWTRWLMIGRDATGAATSFLQFVSLIAPGNSGGKSLMVALKAVFMGSSGGAAVF